jgi:hypothetical protein
MRQDQELLDATTLFGRSKYLLHLIFRHSLFEFYDTPGGLLFRSKALQGSILH